MNLVDILRAVVLALRKLGPYALLELVVPGGTILALLLYLYRRRRDPGTRLNGEAKDAAVFAAFHRTLGGRRTSLCA